jgi:tetratricopeptide (TPR) repeat protein
MYERGMFGPAVKLARTGLEIAKALECETRLLRADLFTVIGGVQVEGTELEESYQSLKSALDLRLAAVQAGLMDEKHPQIANSYMGLGTAAVGIGRVQEALKLGEQSISQRAGSPDEQIQMFAMSYHNVALATLHNGQLDKADAFIKKSMELTSVTSQSMTPEQKL